jgi:hypothetical protein
MHSLYARTQLYSLVMAAVIALTMAFGTRARDWG